MPTKFQKVSRDDPYYKMCLAGSTMVGLAVGRFGGLQGLLVGGLTGFAIGYLACPYVAPGIRKKIEGDKPLTEQDLFSAVQGMKRYSGVKSDEEAIKLVALVKKAHSSDHEAPLTCANPVHTASKLLRSA